MISVKTGQFEFTQNFSSNRRHYRQNSDFDNLFLLPKCALASHKKFNLRRDLARYNFNINIVADTPKGNVWISGNKDTANMQQQQQQQACRPGSATKDHSLTQKEREERIKQLKEKQNEERQKKLEDLKAQAMATQKFREQKEEERRKRIDDIKCRDNDKRSQVEERKKAIWEAEKERREYILRKNLERDQRLESKRKNERSQIAFAFGSSTPRMLDSESGSIWAHRRANSIQNVAYNASISPITRRSCERELGDGSKKRAISASGLDRQLEAQKRMSTSMHEVFHWGPNTSAAPKKLAFSVAGSQIDFEGPPSPRRQTPSARNAARNRHSMVIVANNQDDSCDMTRSYNVHRRKTDLMPTIPSPRDTCRSSLGSYTPRTPGRAFSMTRLDQLAQPKRRNGEHISAIVERERRQALELENMSKMSLSQGAQDKRKSRSMSQLGGRVVRSRDGSRSRQDRFKTPSPLQRHHKNDATKSMTQLTNGVDKKSSKKAGLRSGEITPKSMSTSRPGSAMSTSTTNSGVVTKRLTPVRKPRPVSIAGTGVSRDGEKPPMAPISAPKSSIKRTPSTSGKTSTVNTETQPKSRPSSAKATPKSSNTPSILSPSVECQPIVVVQQVVTVAKEVVAADDASKSEKTIINNVIKAEQQHTEANLNGTHLVDAPAPAPVPATEAATVEVVAKVPAAQISKAEPQPKEPAVATENPLENSDMTSSMMAKSRITTEEEAKAKITERRRLAREEAEKQAELERKRLLEEEEFERQRQLEEEERQRQLELETIRLGEEQRRVEEERLQQAIEENQKREEEEKKRKEEEAQQKIERELVEKKAREDAEKAKAETAERLKVEEKEREERRKRVEAIMARTRKGGNANTPSKNDSDAVDMSKSQIDSMSQSMIEQTLSTEQSNTDSNQESQAPTEQDYEKSVTEKENLLMSSFNKMNLNGNGLNNNLLETNNNINLLNGQTNGKSDAPSDLIIGDVGLSTNGHEKTSIESAFSPDPSAISSKPSEDKLIDFGGNDTAITNSDHQTSTMNNNFIDNNSSLITHNLNNNNLVAATENNDERELSLL